MSLIHDALKRARESMPPPVPSGSPSNFRPAEATPQSRVSLKLFLILGAILIAGVVFTAQYFSGSAPAATPTAAAAKPVPAPAPHAAMPVLAKTSDRTVAGTNATATAAAPPPPPAPRLQAVFFSASQPSAMISGKTVFVNSQFEDFRVAAIRENSVTLINPAKTVVLKLHE